MVFKQGDRFGDYVLDEQISSSGASGDVWRVSKIPGDIPTFKYFALKIIRGHALHDKSHIRSEAANWSSISKHPNVANFIEIVIHEEEYIGFVSEYFPEGNLLSLLREGISIEEAIRLTISILKGLQHVHSHKIIHRDLKPENVLISHGVPSLIDFGISRFISENMSRRMTGTLGTPEYAAPEAWNRSTDNVDQRTDIWSVGVILYEMIEGELPFEGNPETIEALVKKEPPRSFDSHVQPELKTIVLKALEKSPNARFQTADEMRIVLESVLEQTHEKNPTNRPSEAVTNNQKIQLIVCDIEGCLMPPRRGKMAAGDLAEISAYCDAATKDNTLPPLVFCSGRQTSYAECLAQMIGAFFPGYPSVVENGAYLYDIANNHLRRNAVLTASFKEKLDVAAGSIAELIELHQATKEPGKDICLSLNPSKYETIEQFYASAIRLLREWDYLLEITHSQSAVDITPKGVNKGSAIRQLSKILRIPVEEMLGIGDSHGDLPMLQVVGTRACPANASAEIKDISHFVAEGEGPHGVSEILLKYTHWDPASDN